MALVQNYVGLDARIYAIVRSLLNGESVDLSDYYTKAEVDALIASGGGSLTIDYNNLINRPIINGLLQSNLDINNYLLLKNGEQLYLPQVIENIITFDKNIHAPNLITTESIEPYPNFSPALIADVILSITPFFAVPAAKKGPTKSILLISVFVPASELSTS